MFYSNANVNPVTGIRYGVIKSDSLHPDIVHDLFYGSGAVDLSFKDAIDELRKALSREADAFEEEVDITIAERGGMTEDEAGAFMTAAWERKGYQDRDDFLSTEEERRSECMEIDEPIIEGKYNGVKYRISWLGGASLV